MYFFSLALFCPSVICNPSQCPTIDNYSFIIYYFSLCHLSLWLWLYNYIVKNIWIAIKAQLLLLLLLLAAIQEPPLINFPGYFVQYLYFLHGFRTLVLLLGRRCLSLPPLLNVWLFSLVRAPSLPRLCCQSRGGMYGKLSGGFSVGVFAPEETLLWCIAPKTKRNNME